MTLYKYLEPERVDVLENRKIRFSQINALNDPFEGKPFYDRLAPAGIIAEKLEEGRSNLDAGFREFGGNFVHDFFVEFEKVVPDKYRNLIQEMREELPSKEEMVRFVDNDFPDFVQNTLTPLSHEMMPLIRQQIVESFNQKFGIFCLSKSNANNLMWAHYAKNSQGLVVGFDESHSYFGKYDNKEPKIDCLWPVEYSKKRPGLKHMVQLTLDDIVFTKPLDWAYEKEWRIIKLLSPETLITDADGNPRLDELSQPVHLFTFPPDAVQELAIGSRASTLLTEQLCELVQRTEYLHVDVYQTIESERYYQLEFTLIRKGASR